MSIIEFKVNQLRLTVRLFLYTFEVSKAAKSKCPVVRGEVDLSKYENLDGEWRKIGLASPARRALVDAKLYKVSDLRKITIEELSELHGVGTSAIARLKVVMDARKIRFR